jgi:putative Holliday junction resolvase
MVKGKNGPSPVAACVSRFPENGTILAFDFGEKRIGVAVGELALGIAHPLTIIDAEDTRTRFAAISRLIDEWRPAELVVGVPAHDDGRAHPVGQLARRFARRLEGRFGIVTRLIDERLTSHTAESRLRESGVAVRRIRQALDAAAAQEILQSYFATCRESGANDTHA